ncbi:HPr kinase/phosphorylase [Hasllibacter sp. MH4015]|uniref:HPr kinase/phosphorylase n=1 Tax=Hasllibacter sp. MH4015 TaxID=2854029 RepID=UPI001CD5E9D1|nr:AAA family ATPase [Hasllibacter sp. MH4015]
MADPTPEPLEHWAQGADATGLHLHATAIALAGQSVLMLGPSGSGKSSLALQLLVLGAQLIADDGIRARVAGDTIQISRPDTAPPFIEARGIGLLKAGPLCASARLTYAVDLERAEPERLPPRRFVTLGTARAQLILGAGHPTLAAALLHALRHGRAVP